MPTSSANPSRQIAIITCMDARIDPLAAFGLELGEAHVLRNGGALVTDDVLRSLVMSQRFLGTRSIAVMAHTLCGLRNLPEEDVAATLERETGSAPPFSFGAFAEVDEHVRDQVQKLRDCVWLPHRDDVRGYVLDVTDGSVRSVE